MSNSKEVKQANMPKSQAYLFMVISFVAGFFLATAIMSSQEAPVQKRPLGSGSTNMQQEASLDQQTMRRIAQLELELAQSPKDAEKWATLGNLYYAIPMPTESIKAYQEVIKLQPNNTNVMTDMGTMYRANNQFETAIQQYDKALSIDSKHQNARFNRGVVLLFDLDRKQEAINTWKILVQQSPQRAMPNGQLLADFIKELEQTN